MNGDLDAAIRMHALSDAALVGEILTQSACGIDRTGIFDALIDELHRRLARNPRCPMCRAELPLQRHVCRGCAYPEEMRAAR